MIIRSTTPPVTLSVLTYRWSKYSSWEAQRLVVDHVLGPLLGHRVRVGQVSNKGVLQDVERLLAHGLSQSQHLVVGDAGGIVALLPYKRPVAVGIEGGDVQERLEWKWTEDE